jgi:hypothetical protein
MAKSNAKADQPMGTTETSVLVVKKVSKTQAVREALRDLGRDAMPTTIWAHVMKRYNLDMSLNHISNIKSTLNKNAPKRGRPKKDKGSIAVVAVVESSKPAPSNGKRAGAAVDFKDIEVTKELAQRVGVKQLHALIDLVSK